MSIVRYKTWMLTIFLWFLAGPNLVMSIFKAVRRQSISLTFFLCFVMFNRRMSPFFTAGLPSSPLWFAGWIPTNPSTTVLACFGLFGLTILSKFLNVVRHKADQAWDRPRNSEDLGVELIEKRDQASPSRGSSFSVAKRTGAARPFSAIRDVSSGALAALSGTLGYLLMVRRPPKPPEL